MKYVSIPIEKVVKYDAEGYSFPECPICESSKMQLQLLDGDIITVYCNTDEIYFRFNNGEISEIDFAVYQFDDIRNYNSTVKSLERLFVKGLISYANRLTYVMYAGEKLSEGI